MHDKMIEKQTKTNVQNNNIKNDDYDKYESFIYNPKKIRNSNSHGNLEHYLNQDVVEGIPRLEIKF